MGNSNKKAILIVSSIAVLSKIFGFMRDIVLAYYWGASNVTDVYFISTTIPEFIFSLMIQIIAVGFIPIFTEILQKEGTKKANEFTNQLLTIMYFIGGGIVCIVNLFPEFVVGIFASGFDAQTTGLAIKFIRITILTMFFKGTVSVFSAYAHAKGEFTRPALIGLPLDIVLIIFTIMSYYTNSTMLAVGVLVATISQLIILTPYMYKEGFKMKWRLNLKDDYIKRMLALFLPVALGVGANQINILVDRTLASRVSSGAISALNYANKVENIMQNIIIMSIVSVVYPTLSKMVANNDLVSFKKETQESIDIIMLLMIPISIGSMLFAQPIIKMLFGRGAFDDLAISMTANAMFFYSIGMVGVSLRAILTRAFYALQEVKIPMINSCISIIVNIVLNIILLRYFGLSGLTLATSLSAILCAWLMVISLNRKGIKIFDKDMVLNVFKILIASITMGVGIYLTNRVVRVFAGDILSMLISIGMGGMIYIPLLFILKIKGIDFILVTIKNKFKK